MINHKESIDALRRIKRGSSFDTSPPKEFKENTLRSEFKASLTKLLGNETREQGMKELKSLVAQFKTTASLRIWLSVLAENRVKSNEGEVLIIGFVINQYKKGLIDPLDKTPSLEKTIFRVLELLRKFFSDDTLPVQMACQKAWLEIYKSCLEGESLETKKRLGYDTLEAIINGGADKQSQVTAQIIIDGLLESALSKSDLEFFREIAKPSLVLFLKTYIIHPASITSLQTILSFFKMSNLEPLAEGIIDKLAHFLNNAPSNSLGYKIRSECCNTLGMAAEQLTSIELEPKVVPVLEALTTDRIWAVQMSARKALDLWKKRKSEFLRWEEEKQTKLRDMSQLKQSIESLYLESKGDPQVFRGGNRYRTGQLGAEHNREETPSEKPINKSDNGGGFLRQDEGNGGGYFHKPLVEEKPSYQPQHKRMAEIKREIQRPKSKITDFEETVPYEQDLALGKLKSETAPEGFNLNRQPKNPRQISAPSDLDEADDNLLQRWQEVLQHYQNSRFEDAYKLVLEMDDDIYFIRLLVKTGPVLDRMTKPTSTKLLKKLLHIMKSDFINQLFLGSVNSSIKNNVPNILENKQNKAVINVLDRLSKTPRHTKTASNLKTKYENVLSAEQ